MKYLPLSKITLILILGCCFLTLTTKFAVATQRIQHLPINGANDGLEYQPAEPEPDQGFITDIADWSIQLNAPMTSSLKLADVTGDGYQEVVATTYGPQPNPYNGGRVFVVDKDGEILPGWPLETNSPFSSGAAIGDVDDDGDMEIAVGSWSSMYLLNADASNYEGWPIGTGVNYAPSLADIDGNGDLEIIYPSGNILYVRNHDGSYFDNFPVSAPEQLGSPAIGDIDNDGQLEIIACTLAGPVGPDPYEIYAWKLDGTVMDGFPVATSGVVKSTPALGDVNNDGYLEIVTAAYHTSNLDYIYCIDYQGNSLDGWPIRANYVRLSSPALADINDDGYLEIFIGGLNTQGGFTEILFGFDYQGLDLDGWPVFLPHDGDAGNINSSPVVAEIDDETGSPEIFVKTYGFVFGLNSDGSFIDGSPFAIDDDGNSGTYAPAPAIGDIDNDGDADFIFGSASGRLYYVDGAGNYDAERSDWPMYKHDQWGLGRFGGTIETGIADANLVPSGFAIYQNYPNPFNRMTTIKYDLLRASYISITIYDILGREVTTLDNGLQQAGHHQVGVDMGGQSSGIYYYKLQAGQFIQTRRMIYLK